MPPDAAGYTAAGFAAMEQYAVIKPRVRSMADYGKDVRGLLHRVKTLP
jgi:hypothetical protein